MHDGIMQILAHKNRAKIYQSTHKTRALVGYKN